MESSTPIFSFTKAVSWRILGTLTTFCVTFSLTYNVHISMMVGVIEVALKIFLYYLHERFWERCRRSNKLFLTKLQP